MSLDNPQEHESNPEGHPTQPSLDGEVLDGRFMLEALLGEGSFGAVYRALDLETNTPVAVKVLHAGLSANDTVVARFEREARAAAMLRHPNGVEVVAFGAANERPWMAMELLDGRNLEQALADGPLHELSRVASITSQLCDALTAAHARGIVHRDIKPANVMLCGADESHVKLCDFGIARLRAVTADDGRPLTAAGEVIGSPAYLAPEQARGDKIDHRCDIYALGILLYEMTTGKLPYAGGTPMRMLLQHITDEPTPPSAHDPDYPAALERIVMRCLSKDPDARYQTASYLQSELTTLLTDPRVHSWTASGLIPVQRTTSDTERTGFQTDRPALDASNPVRNTLSRAPEDAEPATGDAPALEAFHINRTDPNLRRPAELARKRAADADADAVDQARRRSLLIAAALGLGVVLVIVLLALSGCDSELPPPADPGTSVPGGLSQDLAEPGPLDDTLAPQDTDAPDTSSADLEDAPDDSLDVEDGVADTDDVADTVEDTSDTTEPVDMGPPVFASCLAARDAGQPTGLTWLGEDQPMHQVWCEQEQQGGGWTLVATLSNSDSANWVPGTSPSPWEQAVNELGTADPTVNADYRASAFDVLRVNELRITVDNTFLLRTNACLNQRSLSAVFGALDWACTGSESGGFADCSLACDIAEQNAGAETQDVLLGGADATALYLKAGETDAADPAYTDRTYLSTNHRGFPHNVGGLGARCIDQTGGGGCSGATDISIDNDNPTPGDPAHFYSLWVR